jgi:hypothetical protein
MRRGFGVLALSMLGALLGCDPAGVTLEQEIADIETMRAVWESQGIDDYYIEIRQGNEWVPPFTIGIEVRDGDVTRIRGPIDQMAAGSLTTWYAPQAWDRSLAVDSLYARMARAVANPEWEVDARFDTKLGVPTWMFFDMPAWADDSYSFKITRFVRQ